MLGSHRPPTPRRSTPLIATLAVFGLTLVTGCPGGDEDGSLSGCTCYSEEATARVTVPDVSSASQCAGIEEANNGYFECEWEGAPVVRELPGLVSPE